MSIVKKQILEEDKVAGKTPTQLEYNRALCAQEIDEILKKYGFTLTTFSKIEIVSVNEQDQEVSENA